MGMDPKFAFRHDVRVRFPETDAQGVVYHANFLIYADVARVEYLRALAGGDERLQWREDRGYDLVLVHAACDFRASAHFDDLLTVWVCVGRLGNSSLGFEYRVERGQTLVCEVKTVHCAIDRQARTSLPLPEELKQRVRAFEASLRPLRA